MPGIPLPALAIRPPAPPPNPLQQFGQLLGLRTVAQEEPLEVRRMAERNQQLGLQNQMQQLNLADIAAQEKAFQNLSGTQDQPTGAIARRGTQPSSTGAPTSGVSGKGTGGVLGVLNHYIPTLMKTPGVLPSTIFGAVQNIEKLYNTASETAKYDAETGTTNLATEIKRNDLVSGELKNLLKLPSAQLVPALVSTTQSLSRQGLIGPDIAQQAMAMAQSGNPEMIRNKLGFLSNSMLARSEIMKNAQEEASAKSSTESATLKQVQLAYDQAHGLVPGVSPTQQMFADWMQAHPGENPDQFARFTGQQSPMYQVANEQFLSPEAQSALGNLYGQTGHMAPGLSRSPATAAGVAEAAAEQAGLGGSSLGSQQANYAANAASLRHLTQNYDAVQAFEGTAQRNIDLLQAAASKIPDWRARYANIPIRALSGSVLGTKQMAAFRSALTTAQTEVAKVLNSANLSGQLSDSARHELQQVIDGNLSYNAMVSTLKMVQADMHNRTTAYRSQLESIRHRIGLQTRIKIGPDNTIEVRGKGRYRFKSAAVLQQFMNEAGMQ